MALTIGFGFSEKNLWKSLPQVRTPTKTSSIAVLSRRHDGRKRLSNQVEGPFYWYANTRAFAIGSMKSLEAAVFVGMATGFEPL